MQAGALFGAGHSQAEVARTFGVARQNVSRWQAAGLQALASRKPIGPAPRLSDGQRAAIDQALRQGARAHGFDTDHWTLARITTVIEQLTGTSYHAGHTWKLLRRMGWRLQRPARRAAERDEQAIAGWVVEDWPEVLATPGAAPCMTSIRGLSGGVEVGGHMDAAGISAVLMGPQR
jgi:transposase